MTIQVSEYIKFIKRRAVTDHCFMLSMNANYSEDDYVLAIDDSIESELLPLVYLPFIQLLSHEVSTDLKVFSTPIIKDV